MNSIKRTSLSSAVLKNSLWPVFAYYPWVHANEGAVSSAWHKPLLGRLRVQSWPEACMQIEQLKSLRLSRQLPVSQACSPFPIPLLSLPLCQSPVSLGQMVCVSSMPVLIFHYGPLPRWEREMLHNVWVCLFNPMMNAGAGEECVEKGSEGDEEKAQNGWGGGGRGCEEAEARRERERQRQGSERRTAVKEAKEKGRDKV